MTAGVGFKSTVHFSTSFSTTRTSFRQNGTALSCRHSHSRLRHFFDDFGEGCFGRLFLSFLLTHSAIVSRVRGVYWSIWIMYSESKRAYRHSLALLPSRSVDTYVPKPELF